MFNVSNLDVLEALPLICGFAIFACFLWLIFGQEIVYRWRLVCKWFGKIIEAGYEDESGYHSGEPK